MGKSIAKRFSVIAAGRFSHICFEKGITGNIKACYSAILRM